MDSDRNGKLSRNAATVADQLESTVISLRTLGKKVKAGDDKAAYYLSSLIDNITQANPEDWELEEIIDEPTHEG